MKYIIMCGGDYKKWETPRHLSIVNGEELVARTIRLLRQNGIEDIAISSNNPVFKKFGVPVLEHDNLYIANGFGNVQGDWFNAFYPTEEPACYLFGDVYFSDEAIKKIIETETDDIELFGSQPPFAKNYIKTHEEPFALKVMNQKHLREAIDKTRELDKEHKFWRKPIVWELFTVIKNAPLQIKKDEYTIDYTVINDYTCDIDFQKDILDITEVIGGKIMIKVEAIADFTLERFDEIKNLVKVDKTRNEYKKVYAGDIFECDRKMADYLNGGNAKGAVVVKVLEIIPEITKKVVEKEIKPIEEFFDTEKIYDEAKIVDAKKIEVKPIKKSSKKKNK